MGRMQTILTGEGVSFNPQTLASLIMKHAPDWRRVLNECQRYSISGQLETTVIITDANENYSVLFKALKGKDFKKMRGWVVNNMDVEPASVFRGIYDAMNEFVQPQSIPQLVLILADYQYKNSFVADHELNLVACMTEIMANVEVI
tara:strand:+ start:163 stop:600 length:438 start_codon:yes stop_codon:yes gene_type:complete